MTKTDRVAISLGTAGGAARSLKPMTDRRNVSESADAYPAVVTLSSRERVIESACHSQWIVQVRSRKNAYPWESVSFCRTKAGLLQCAGAHPILSALPDRFPDTSETHLEDVDNGNSRLRVSPSITALSTAVSQN